MEIGDTFLPLLLLATIVMGEGPETPTASQLWYQGLEVGAFFQYNLGLYGEEDANYACSNFAESAT